MKRERLFTMKMSDEEHARIAALAEHYGVTMADVIRMIVKRDLEEIRQHRKAR